MLLIARWSYFSWGSRGICKALLQMSTCICDNADFFCLNLQKNVFFLLRWEMKLECAYYLYIPTTDFQGSKS